MDDAARRWAEGLAAWALPAHILQRAAESPWHFDPSHFRRRAELAASRRTPADIRALEALGDGGTVLDVGCGSGAASRPLIPPATAVTGVDASPEMVTAFTEVMGDTAAKTGVAVQTVEGAWNTVAPRVNAADVVVCHDVLYNEPDLRPFVAGLTDHARRRVVVVLPTAHPQSWTTPYWRELHGLDRPTGPVADDAVAVIASLGVDVHTEHYSEPTLWADTDDDHVLASLRRRLCLTPTDDPALREAVGRYGLPRRREAVAVWWDTG